VLPVDLTSTWIPLSLLAVLCGYMFILFQRERRATLAFEGMETMAPAPVAHASSHGGGSAMAAAPAPAPLAPLAPVAPSPVTSEERKPRLLWRTASIWLPFVGGFAGQAYFDIIAPLMEKAAG
jgi:hypothetical protein